MKTVTQWSNTPGPLLITTNELAGQLASWAVQQSPYDFPEGLETAITDFRKAWPFDPELPSFLCLTWGSYQELRAALEKLFCETPSIEAWNHRKNGRDGMGFSSRYDRPSPDDDFIDLGALANNVARTVWKDALEFKAFNDDFDARHAPKTDGDEHDQ